MKIRVDANATRVAVSPSLYGIFFEEINHAGEGGLYAEMVLNRDFEINTLPSGASWAGNLLMTRNGWYERKWFSHALHGWSLIAEGGARGSIRQDGAAPLHLRNPHSMRLTARTVGTRLGVANGGFWGMNFQAGRLYDLSFYARTEGGERFDLTVSLESAIGHQAYAAATVGNVGGAWKQYRCALQPTASNRNGRLAIAVNRPGTIWFDVVSLFPRDTFMHRPNGLRADLAEMLAELKPAFVRFPGGAVAGGLNLDNRVQWKHSIGDIAQRQGTMNLWGYYSTHGLGFHEYLQLCEDLGAAALYVCNPGMSDGYRRGENATPEDLPAFIQEALDALEYALGPVESAWGAQRADNGHPAPFPLRYIEIGNEAGGAEYAANYRRFYEAIRPSYPRLTIICNQRAGGGAPVEVVDDHQYGSPADLFDSHRKYDAADRGGPAVYVGEYGCNREVGEGNLMGALSEAAYLMGLERNSDLVRMCSYAPLFFNVNDIAWPVNLIGFDSARVVGRTSYHVQQLFARNRPDEVMPTRVEDSGPSMDVYALAGLNATAREVVIKAVNRSARTQPVELELSGLDLARGRGRMITLSHEDPTAENSLDDPEVVAPVESELNSGSERMFELMPHSLTVLRLPLAGG